MAKVIGIDLGTTNSLRRGDGGRRAGGHPQQRGQPHHALDGRASPRPASAWSGQIAKRQAITNPENTVFAVKRLIGRKFDSPEVEEGHRRSALPGGAPPRTATPGSSVRGKALQPAGDLARMVLHEDEADRRGLPGRAGHRGGDHRPRLLQRRPAPGHQGRRAASPGSTCCASSTSPPRPRWPTAWTRSKDGKTEKVAVYDLGGGTFDISILELNGGVFEVQATNGDTFLGGEDFDQRIIDWLAEQLHRQRTASTCARTGWRCSGSRRRPSAPSTSSPRRTETEVNLPFITADATGPKHLTETLDRAASSRRWSTDLIERTLEPCRIALKDAGLDHRSRSTRCSWWAA